MCFFLCKTLPKTWFSGLAVLLRNCHCACPQLVIVVLCELWPCVIVVRCVPCGGLWWLVVRSSSGQMHREVDGRPSLDCEEDAWSVTGSFLT